MLHRPEEVLQIGVHDPLPTALNLLPNFAHGVLRRSPSPISEVGFVEHRPEDRFQPIEQRLLAHPVVNRRDSQCAKLARLPRLRDLPFPAHFRRRLPGHAAFTALAVLHSRPSTGRALLATSLSLIGLLTPVPPGDPASPPEVTHRSSVPCHPQTPWCGG